MSISAVDAPEAVTREAAVEEADLQPAHTREVQTAREMKCVKLFIIRMAVQILTIAV